MTTQNSDFMALVDASPPRLSAGGGIIKCQRVVFTQVGAGGGAGDIARLFKMPAGGVLLLGMSFFANNVWTGASINLGWEAYQKPDGVIVAASSAGLATTIAMTVSVPYRTLTAAVSVAAYAKQFEGPAVITAITTGAAIPSGGFMDAVFCWI